MTRNINQYCHRTNDVVKRLIQVSERDHDKAYWKAYWWDYITATRGDDFNENSLVKVFFTCPIRGYNHSMADYNAWDISHSLQYISQFTDNLLQDSFMVEVIDIFHQDRYNHYRNHVVSGLNALSVYYIAEAEVSCIQERDNIFLKCSELIRKMSFNIDDFHETDYFKNLREFLLLVSDEV
jgi:hypothetical protein